MSMRVTLALASMVVGACSFSPGGSSGGPDVGVIDAPVVDGPAIDGATIDGAAIDAAATDAAIDACASACVGNVVETCGVAVETCTAGCSEVGTVHCKQLIPSNGVTEADDLTGTDADVVLMAARLYTFNTSTGEIRFYPLDGSTGGTLVRPAGTGLDPTTKIRWRAIAQTPPGGSMPTPELGIFGMKSLTVPATTILRPISPAGTRAAVLVAHDPITVGGEIDVGGGRQQTAFGAPTPDVPGAGGFRGGLDPAAGMGAQGCAPGGNGSRQTGSLDTGGGGGGFGTAGGKGGPASANLDGGGVVIAAAVLPTACAQFNMNPLRGGSGGGCGQGGNNGGGGGGALQLTSFTAIMITGGTLYAGGAGGDGTSGAGGGGAGGSGGGLLLEAPVVSVTGGSLTATGGGGGAGNNDTNPAENGRRDGMPAQPTGNGGTGGTGPNAGAGEVLATAGGGNVDGTGGGGAGTGLIHFRSLMLPVVDGTAVVRPMGTSSTMATTP